MLGPNALGRAWRLVFGMTLAIAGLGLVPPQALAQGHAERDGIGLLSLEEIATFGGARAGPHTGVTAPATATTSATAAAVVLDPRRSLLVTDLAIVSQFSFAEVMSALAADSTASITPQALYDQWMDLHNRAPGIGQGGHCNDQTSNGIPSLNGFAFDCPRAEGQLVGRSPFDSASGDGFFAIALSNRFDLATPPTSKGADCGEYRIVFAKRSGVTNAQNRLLIIFEAVLPNPAPNGKDLGGCRPVAEFWAGLTAIADPAVRAARLKDFYFKGLPGFAPVIRASHLGNATAVAKGQVRTNMFMQFNWLMREYRFVSVNNLLRAVAAPNGLQPAGLLFNETIAHPLGSDFRNTFLKVVGSLATSDIHRFHMNGLPSRFDSGDADEQDTLKSAFVAQFRSSPTFAASIQQRLRTGLIRSTLTPQDIVERASAMSCAGCHQLSSGKSIGGGLVWPQSLGFVHVTEAATENSPDGPLGSQRFVISPALVNVLLPHRKAVLEAFLGP